MAAHRRLRSVPAAPAQYLAIVWGTAGLDLFRTDDAAAEAVGVINGYGYFYVCMHSGDAGDSCPPASTGGVPWSTTVVKAVRAWRVTRVLRLLAAWTATQVMRVTLAPYIRQVLCLGVRPCWRPYWLREPLGAAVGSCVSDSAWVCAGGAVNVVDASASAPPSDRHGDSACFDLHRAMPVRLVPQTPRASVPLATCAHRVCHGVRP